MTAPSYGGMNRIGYLELPVVAVDNNRIWLLHCALRLLITNRKSYMSFRLVPKSVILNDLERCNMALILSYSTEIVYDVVVKQLLG